MDEINTNTTPISNDDVVITDATIEEVHPTTDELVLEKKPLTEAEAEAEVGADEPTEVPANLNNEDEEAEKQESIS